MRPLLLACCALLATSCLSASWNRESRFAPPTTESVDSLCPGESDLTHCLDALGAPLWVGEFRGDGVALAYGWLETVGWSVNVSLPVSDNLSVSFDYTDVDEEMEGIVLLLDEKLVLRELRRGLLRDLTIAVGRARPAPLTD